MEGIFSWHQTQASAVIEIAVDRAHIVHNCPTKMDCDHKRSWQDPALFAGKFTIHSHTAYLL